MRNEREARKKGREKLKGTKRKEMKRNRNEAKIRNIGNRKGRD